MADNDHQNNGEPSSMTVRTPATDDTGYEGGTEGSDVDTLGLNCDEEAARGGALMDTTLSLVSTITSCDANSTTTNNNNNKITHALEHKDKPKDDDQDDTTTHQDHGYQHAAEDGTADGVILFDEQDGESSEQTSICRTVVAWTGDYLSTATPLTSPGDNPTSLAAAGTPSMATQGHVNAALSAASLVVRTRFAVAESLRTLPGAFRIEGPNYSQSGSSPTGPPTTVEENTSESANARGFISIGNRNNNNGDRNAQEQGGNIDNDGNNGNHLDASVRYDLPVAVELANLPPSAIGIQQHPLSAIPVVDAVSSTYIEHHPRVAYEELRKQQEHYRLHTIVFKIFWGLVAITALGVGLGMGLRNRAKNEDIIAARDEEIGQVVAKKDEEIGQVVAKKDEEIEATKEELMAQAATKKKQELFMYHMTLFQSPETNETERCRNGYAPSCGDCWCSADDDWSGEEGSFICPQYPTGWIDSCTPLERRLKVSSHFKRYVKRTGDSSSDEETYLNEDSLPIISDIYSQTDSPLVIPTNDGTDTTFCNPFGESIASNNPFADLPPCFVVAPIDENVDQPVCVFRQTSVGNNGNNTEVIYESQTLALDEALAFPENAEIVHSGPCGMCSTAQDLVALIENIDSWYATSNACIIASVMAR